jgi:hypothetical protein
MVIIGIVIGLFLLLSFFYDLYEGAIHNMKTKYAVRLCLDVIMFGLYMFFVRGV